MTYEMENLFFRLPENIRRDVFHFTEESEQELHEKISELLNNPDKSKNDDSEDESSDDGCDHDKYCAVSKFGLTQIPTQYIAYTTIENPYYRWSRRKHENLFRWGNFSKEFPNGKISLRYQNPLIAYITSRFEAFGAYGKVKTLVAFRGHLSIIKSMNENKRDFFELVTQAFLHDFCLKHYTRIKVPELLFLQHSSESVVDACMARGRGKFLSDIIGLDLKIAFAHVLRALWFLQRDVFFMHRDLGAQNVMFDKVTNIVTFIDFGMSCLNPPTPKDVSWSGRTDFYRLGSPGHAEKCTNRSLDACVLLETLYKAENDPFFNREHGQMRAEMEKTIRSTENLSAKEEFYHKDYSMFTHITKYKGNEEKYRNLDVFYMGNANDRDVLNPHWWVYNCVEFPLGKWFPENVLGRLLREIPFKDWFALRKNWPETFDGITPTGIQVVVKKGAPVYLADKTEMRLLKTMPGIFLKCVRHNLRIRLVDFAIVTVSPEYIIR
jgi:hypothetical protein